MSVRYRAIAAAYSRNSGRECAINKRSSQYACTRGGPVGKSGMQRIQPPALNDGYN